MPTEIAQRERAQDRVADRVEQHVGVRMSVEAAIVGDRHAAQHQRATGDQRMHMLNPVPMRTVMFAVLPAPRGSPRRAPSRRDR